MDRLEQAIEKIRQKLPNLKRRSLKETSTRIIIIDPLLEALGWNVQEPDDVQLEYPTVDGKSVDYALKINKKPVLLVEAKALDDPLTDVKSVTQVISYAANDGIVWCILTNGIRWKVYKSSEECAAPEKLLFEVDLEGTEKEGLSLSQITKQLWRLSAEELARGSLGELGERVFTDTRVRKAMLSIISSPPRPLLNLLRKSKECENLPAEKIKNSLSRIAKEILNPDHELAPQLELPSAVRRTQRAKEGQSQFTEEHHTYGKPQEVIDLFSSLDRFCLNLSEGCTKRILKRYITYEYDGDCFCFMVLLRNFVRIYLRLQHSRLPDPPAFARDVSGIGHWGPKDLELELNISSQTELEESYPLIRSSFEKTSANIKR